MASQNPNHRNSLYPEVIDSNPEASSPFLSNPNPNHTSSSNLYPSIDYSELVENLFPDINSPGSPTAPPEATEEVLITVPGAILHLIDKEYSVELACGDFTVVCLRQCQNVVAVYARVADEIQWPLAKDEAAVKVDDNHYFFSFRVPDRDPNKEGSDSSDDEGEGEDRGKVKGSGGLLSYGLTIASKGQEDMLKELDKVLMECSGFSVQKVSEKAKKKGEALDGSVAKEISPADLKSEKKKDLMEERSAAYWTTLAPNVEDYSGTAARLIAAGSGQLIKGILWCGDVTVERLKWGNEVMKKRLASGSGKEISPETLKRIKREYIYGIFGKRSSPFTGSIEEMEKIFSRYILKKSSGSIVFRVKRVTKMTENVANGVLSGVVKVSGFFTSSVANSKAGKKFFSLLPGEVVLASLDGFSKVCDAVEVAGKNVMSTSSTVTTELVNHRYGEEAAKATSEGLGAAGHAVGTAWAAFKIRQALNPKSVIKPTNIAKYSAKAAAAEFKAKKSK